MAGSKESGRKAAITMKAKYGEDFFVKTGAKANEAWVRNGKKPRGFAAMPKEKVRAAGSKGGSASPYRPQHLQD